MAITNHERVGKALELLKAGLGPFAEREFANTYQTKAQSQAALFSGRGSPAGQEAGDAVGRGRTSQAYVGCVE